MRVVRIDPLSILDLFARRSGPAAVSAGASPPPLDIAGGAASVDDRDILMRVEQAISAERVDLYLQPIVSLPQRKPRYYEAFSRLRDEAGRVLTPASYVAAAERANRIGAIDNLILTRCIEAIRRCGRDDPHLVVFCNLSPATLYDTAFFSSFVAYLRANADLASRLIFEFTFPSVQMMHPRVGEGVAEIASLGFAFSVDHIHSLNYDWECLGAHNVRFVKVSAQTLRGLGAGTSGAKAASAETAQQRRAFRKRLSDTGIDLIAEKIEREDDMPAILAMGLDFGQGHLFGPPRPAEHYLKIARREAPVEAAG